MIFLLNPNRPWKKELFHAVVLLLLAWGCVYFWQYAETNSFLDANPSIAETACFYNGRAWRPNVQMKNESVSGAWVEVFLPSYTLRGVEAFKYILDKQTGQTWGLGEVVEPVVTYFFWEASHSGGGSVIEVCRGKSSCVCGNVSVDEFVNVSYYDLEVGIS